MLYESGIYTGRNDALKNQRTSSGVFGSSCSIITSSGFVATSCSATDIRGLGAKLIRRRGLSVPDGAEVDAETDCRRLAKVLVD